MENRAPYQSALKVPRNLAAPIATCLREQGFTVTERHYDATQATVGATWTGPRGDQFELAYIWTSGRHANATLQLQARWPGNEPQNLFGSQRVHRLREVRLLLLGNVRYHNARTLATMPHPAL